jgi:hypothetical protein
VVPVVPVVVLLVPLEVPVAEVPLLQPVTAITLASVGQISDFIVFTPDSNRPLRSPLAFPTISVQVHPGGSSAFKLEREISAIRQLIHGAA